MSRNKREGYYAGHCRYVGHIRGGSQNYEFNTTRNPTMGKAAYIASVRHFVRLMK